MRKFLFAAGLAVVVLCAVIWVLFRSPTSFGSVQHVRDRLESSGFYALGDPERQILSGRSLHCTTFAPDATKPAEGSLRVFHDDKSQVVALSYIVDESADDLATWARSAAVEKLTGFDAPVAVKELTRYPFFSNMDQPDSVCYGFSEGAWLIRGICEKEKPTWGLVVIMHKASW